jgi:hypothetical protein
MINMNSLTRILPFAGAFLLAGAVVACGDDDGGGNTPPDAGTPDAEPGPIIDGGTPDACVGGHGEGCVDSPFVLAEHAEFRLELFQTGPTGTGNDSRLAAQSFFFTDQEPAARIIGGDPITIRPELADQGYVCVSMAAGNRFDNGGTPEAQAIVDTRTYIDVGDNVTMTNVADDTAITLDKYLSSDDPAAATDPSANLIHDILYLADPDVDPALATQYKPAVAGSAAYPAIDLGYGQAAFTTKELADANGVGEPLIYMPSDFQLTLPTEADFYAQAGLTFTKGEDFTITYTIDDPEDVGNTHPTIIPFVGFVKNREIQAYCLKFTADVLDDGEFIVPYEVFEIVDQDPPANEDGSYFEFGRFTHAAWEALNVAEPSRADLMGINCALSADWEILDAPAP